MKQFMVNVRLPDDFTEEFISLIPKQRAMVNSLMRKGIIISYTLSLDRTLLWIVMETESEINVIEVLSEFPLIRFMKPDIREILFHNSMYVNVPKVSLN